MSTPPVAARTPHVGRRPAPPSFRRPAPPPHGRPADARALHAVPDLVNVDVVVCHPEMLFGAALAAVIARADEVGRVATATSAAQVVALAPTGFDVVVVPELLGDEVAELADALQFRGSRARLLTLLSPPVAVGRGRVAVLGPRFPDVTAALTERREVRRAAGEQLARLTSHEHRVLELLAGGTSTTEAAQVLRQSPHTVRACVRRLGAKLGVSGQLGIAAAARELTYAVRPPAVRYQAVQRRWTPNPAAAELSG